MVLQKYVISLKDAKDRRQHITNEFSKHKLDFIFFDAITPDRTSDLVFKFGLAVDDGLLAKVELACLMSHISIWKKALDENIPYIAVFEDDIYLGENADCFLNESKWISSIIDIVKLEVTHDKIVIPSSSAICLSHDRKAYQLKSAHLGAGAYILSNACVKKLFNYIESLEYLVPVDEILFRNLIDSNDFNIFQIVPALCIQDIVVNNGDVNSILKSTLIEDRGVRMKREKHTSLQKVVRELTRMGRQFKLFLFARKIKFK